MAQPVTQASPTGETFNGFVTLVMPALVEFVHSTSALSDIALQVEGAPEVQELESLISVELEPAVGAATIVISGVESATVAQDLARATVSHVAAAGLLNPVATLRALDVEPTVHELRPGTAVAIALSVAAGVAAAVSVIAAWHLLAPALPVRLRRSLADAGIEHPVMLIDANDPSASARFAALGSAVDDPVRVVPVTTAADQQAVVARLAGEGGLQTITDRSDRPAKRPTPIVAVAARTASTDELVGTWSLLSRPDALLAVVFV